MSEARDQRSIDRHLAFLIVALWLPATLFYGGSLAWWNDDYYMCGRDPAHGGAEWWVQTAPTPFEDRAPHIMAWRPIAYGLTSPIITACWNHGWIAHAISAIMHLVGVLLFARLLRELGVAWRARLVGTLVMLCHPAGFEGVQWATVLCVPLSMAMVLGAGVLYVRHLKGELSRTGTLGMIALLGLVPLAYEQTFACVAVFPLAALVVPRGGATRSTDAAGEPRHMRHGEDDALARGAWRALWPLLVAGALLAIYLVVIAKTLPPSVHGSAGSLAPWHEIPRRWAHMVNELRRQLAFKFTGRAAVASGWMGVRENAGRAMAMAGVIGVGVALLARAWARGAPGDGARAGETRRAALLFVMGGAWMVLVMLPVAAVAFASVRPRMVYAAIPGAGLVVAAIADALRARLSRLGGPALAARAMLGLVVLAFALEGVVCLVGTQRGYRLRQLADDASMDALRDAIPTPAPGTLFLPLRVDNTLINVGTSELNYYYASPWYWSYSFPTFVQHGYARRDIFGAYCDYGRAVVIDADERGFTFDGPMNREAPKDAGGRHRFAWDKVVPLGVGAAGEVVFYSPLTIERGEPGAATIEVRPGLVEALRGRGGVRVEGLTIRTP